MRNVNAYVRTPLRAAQQEMAWRARMLKSMEAAAISIGNSLEEDIVKLQLLSNIIYLQGKNIERYQNLRAKLKNRSAKR